MIDLPAYPSPSAADAALIDFGALLRPPLGGPEQRLNRLGSRFKLSVTMPPMQGDTARIWLARLARGQQEGVRMEWPLLDFEPGSPGEPVADGATALGLSLPIKNATPGYAFLEGQWFSIVSGGKHHLHQIRSETFVGDDGKATLPIYPALRRSVLDNDVLHVGKPMLEGFLDGDERMWSMALANFQSFSFEIRESE